jgi:hypothetical protein
MADEVPHRPVSPTSILLHVLQHKVAGYADKPSEPEETLFQPITLAQGVPEHVCPIGSALAIALMPLLHGLWQPFFDLLNSIVVLNRLVSD